MKKNDLSSTSVEDTKTMWPTPHTTCPERGQPQAVQRLMTWCSDCKMNWIKIYLGSLDQEIQWTSVIDIEAAQSDRHGTEATLTENPSLVQIKDMGQQRQSKCRQKGEAEIGRGRGRVYFRHELRQSLVLMAPIPTSVTMMLLHTFTSPLFLFLWGWLF